MPPSKEFCTIGPDGKVSDAGLHGPILAAGELRVLGARFSVPVHVTEAALAGDDVDLAAFAAEARRAGVPEPAIAGVLAGMAAAYPKT